MSALDDAIKHSKTCIDNWEISGCTCNYMEAKNELIDIHFKNLMLNKALDNANASINDWADSAKLLYSENQKLKKRLLELEGVAREKQT